MLSSILIVASAVLHFVFVPAAPPHTDKNHEIITPDAIKW